MKIIEYGQGNQPYAITFTVSGNLNDLVELVVFLKKHVQKHLEVKE
jgi:hypothetical protein